MSLKAKTPQVAASCLMGLDLSGGSGGPWGGGGPPVTRWRHGLANPQGGGEAPGHSRVALGSESKSPEGVSRNTGTSQTGLRWPSKRSLPSPGSIIKPGPPGLATALEPSVAPSRPALRQPSSPLQPQELGPGLRPLMPPWFATCCSQLAFFFSTQKILLSGQNSSQVAVISDSLGELDSEMKGNLQA